MQLNKHFILYTNTCVCIMAFCLHVSAFSQEVNPLLKKLKAKLDKVNDYRAEGRMRTDVAFIKAPAGDVQIFYKRPDKFKVKRGDGISMLPKGGVSVNMSALLDNNDYIALDAGESTLGQTKLKIIKLLPTKENNDIVLTTLYIDEANLLIGKTATTTRDNGTYEIEMSYGKFAQYGLPDKVIFSFNIKDFKLPKGLTMEFESGEKKVDSENIRSKKGRIEILYSDYRINKGVPDSEFR